MVLSFKGSYKKLVLFVNFALKPRGYKLTQVLNSFSVENIGCEVHLSFAGLMICIIGPLRKDIP
jgi:hypothetical protein